MIGAIIAALEVILGFVLDIVTFPFRVIAALLGGSRFEFRHFGRRGV